MSDDAKSWLIILSILGSGWIMWTAVNNIDTVLEILSILSALIAKALNSNPNLGNYASIVFLILWAKAKIKERISK